MRYMNVEGHTQHIRFIDVGGYRHNYEDFMKNPHTKCL